MTINAMAGEAARSGHQEGDRARRDWTPSRATLALIVLTAVVASTTRMLTRSQTPFQWDPVNFALALDKIDLLQHQPHPPPAVGYVLAGRALRLLVGDANLALVVWNLLMTAGGVVLVFMLAARASSRYPERHGWLAVAFLLGSPLVWFYGCVAEIYATEMTLTLLVAYSCLCLLDGRRASAELVALALAALGVFRISGVVFACPLVLYSFWRARPPTAWRAAALLLVATLAWLAPLLIIEGPLVCWRAFSDHLVQTTQPTSVFAGGSLRQLNRHLRDALMATASGIGPFGLVAWPLVLLTRHPRLFPSAPVVGFAALWLLPGPLFYVLVHMAKPGYLLPVVPVLSVMAAFHYGQEDNRMLRWGLAAGHLTLGAAFFLAAQPWTGAAVGEGLRYADKTLSQKARTELGALHFATWHTISAADLELAALRGAVHAACEAPEAALVVGQDGPGLNWRRLMYALPEANVVRLPSATSAGALVARRHHFEPAGPVLEFRQRCPTFWVVSGSSRLLEELRAQASVRASAVAGAEWYVTSTAVSLSLAPGVRLVVR